jgi:hypothetical protein
MSDYDQNILNYLNSKAPNCTGENLNAAKVIKQTGFVILIPSDQSCPANYTADAARYNNFKFCVNGGMTSDQINTVTPVITAIQNCVNNNKVSTSAPAPSPSSSDVPVWIWILAAVIVLLFMLGGIYMATK